MSEKNPPPPDVNAVTQYAAAMNALALFDLSDRVQIELRGDDRQTFLNNFCTHDVKTLQPGNGCEAFLTNIKGRILAHLIVSATDDSLGIDSVPGSGEFIVSHLDKYLITEDVEIVDRTADMGPLCLVGPGAIANGDTTETTATHAAANWLSEQLGDVGEVPMWGQRDATIQGIKVIIRRVGFTRSPAFELVVNHNQRDALRNTMTDAGVLTGSAEVFDALRIEAGFPHYGLDLTDENIAQEAARNAEAISFTKGCYLGQEPIARLDALGHTNKELRILKIESGPVPPPGTIVHASDDKDVGRITSAAVSPGTGHPVGLAMLKTAATAPGTRVKLGDIEATVEPITFPAS